LPVQDHFRHGQVEHCPLCHCEQIVSGGVKYRQRDDAGDLLEFPAPPHTSHAPGWALLAGVGAVALAIVIHFATRGPKPVPALQARVQAVHSGEEQSTADVGSNVPQAEILPEPQIAQLTPLVAAKERGNQGVWSAQSKPAGLPPVVPAKGLSGTPKMEESNKGKARSPDWLAALLEGDPAPLCSRNPCPSVAKTHASSRYVYPSRPFS
jgi:hypothetical protein